MFYNSSHSLHTSTSTFTCFIILLYIPVCSLPTHHGIDKPRFFVFVFLLFIYLLVLFLFCFLYFLLICKIGTIMTLCHFSHWEAKLGDCAVGSLLEKQMIQLPGTAAFDHLFTCFSNPFKRLPWSTELLQGNLYKARELTCKKRKEMQQKSTDSWLTHSSQTGECILSSFIQKPSVWQVWQTH